MGTCNNTEISTSKYKYICMGLFNVILKIFANYEHVLMKVCMILNNVDIYTPVLMIAASGIFVIFPNSLFYIQDLCFSYSMYIFRSV